VFVHELIFLGPQTIMSGAKKGTSETEIIRSQSNNTAWLPDLIFFEPKKIVFKPEMIASKPEIISSPMNNTA